MEVNGGWWWVEFEGVEREMEESEGGGSTCTTHESIYTRKGTGTKREKTGMPCSCEFTGFRLSKIWSAEITQER